EHVVISHGAEGVNWFSAAPSLQALPPKVRVVSTVGAGDSLLAGILASSSQFWSLPTPLLGGMSAAAGIAAVNCFANLA
ncbi:PfkB family carbohydrate kinase, partial [Pseudomonas sp. SIMBA_077]